MEILTIDIILLGAVVTLVGKMLYDLIRHPKNKTHPSIVEFEKLCGSSQDTLRTVGEIEKKLFVMGNQINHNALVLEKNAESYQKFIIAVNDLSNINKNVLAETRAQTEILTKMLLNGRSKNNA